MENLPKHVINKIMFYLSNPVADILKESTIFKYLQLREISIEDNRRNEITIYSTAFNLGCDDGFDCEYDSSILKEWIMDGVIESHEIHGCIAHYDIGSFSYTLLTLPTKHIV